MTRAKNLLFEFPLWGNSVDSFNPGVNFKTNLRGGIFPKHAQNVHVKFQIILQFLMDME